MFEFSNNAKLTDFKPLTDILGLTPEMTYEERVKSRNEYVTKCLKDNPNYEGWDYIEYWAPGNESKLVGSKTAIISTRGGLIKEKGKDKTLFYTKGSLSGFYLRAGFTDSEGVRHLVYVHRIVCSTYVPRNDALKDIGYNELIANHDGLIKTANHFKDLSWMTQSGNVRHAIENGHAASSLSRDNFQERRTLVGKYVLPGIYKGACAFISGKRELLELGFDHTSVYQCARGEIKTAYGFEWVYLDPKYEGNHPTGLALEIIDEIIKNHQRNAITIKPILATIIKTGDMEGQQFVIHGAKRANELGFSQPHISRLCNGKTKLKSHGGCTWKFIEQEEAQQYQKDPTPEQLKYLFNK